MLFIVLLLWITNLNAIDETVVRDPFSFGENQQQTANLNTKKKNKTATSEKANGDWYVKQASDKTMILQNKDGAVREVSFEQKKSD